MRYAILLLRGCLLLSITGLPSLSLAQVTVDSTRSSYTEEHVSYSEEVLTKPLKTKVKPALLDTAALRVQREDRDLWKLGLNNILINDGSNVLLQSYYGYRRFGLHIGYERKLHRPAWSILAEVSPAILRTHIYENSSPSFKWAFSVRTQLAARYYYNLERRIRQGRGAGNFSANYFSLALGTGIGRYSDTPFFRQLQYNQWVRLDGALLYGLQRRLGKYGFIDVNAGVVSLFTGSDRRIQPGGSLRVGLALGAASTQPAPLPEEAARPRMYAGAQVGLYAYSIPSRGYYRSIGVGISPYLYAGRYVRPRLAVQAGLQYQHNKNLYDQFPGPDLQSAVENDEYTFALPLLVRYNITKTAAQRMQFDIVGGAAILTNVVHYQDKLYRGGQLVSQSSGRTQKWAANPMAGLNVAYGFGRKRQVQATLEGVLIKSLADRYYNSFGSLRPGLSVGLRYQFKYL